MVCFMRSRRKGLSVSSLGSKPLVRSRDLLHRTPRVTLLLHPSPIALAMCKLATLRRLGWPRSRVHGLQMTSSTVPSSCTALPAIPAVRRMRMRV